MNYIYLLDTNIVSELTKMPRSVKVEQSVARNSNHSVLSSITWYELLVGMNRKDEGKGKEMLRYFYYNFVAKQFEILPYTSIIADVNAKIFADMVKMGKTPQLADSMIAATAIVNNLTLVTRNEKDFEYIAELYPLKIENWFE